VTRDVAALRRALLTFCQAQLEAFERLHAPGFALPRVFAGHAVGPDVTADLLFTVGQLAGGGVETIAGRHPDDITADLLTTLDGAATHTFFSYRVAESLLRGGPFLGNRLLRKCSTVQMAEVARACDTSDRISELASGRLPRNYAAVFARCELARLNLGLLDDEDLVASMVDKVRLLLSENPLRFLDDSTEGSGRYDIYTANVWLFCEPLAERLGAVWRAGTQAAMGLVEAVGTIDGYAIPWGRSTGVLATALTIELAALSLSRDLASEQAGKWLCRAFDALDSVTRWYSDGLVRAHHYRNQDSYRGPSRWLQLSFDVLGKLAWSAATLLRKGVDPALQAASPAATYSDRDELKRLHPTASAAVWSFRRGRVAFSLPFVGTTRSHYLPAPVQPGRFEVPVDADLPCWTPLVLGARGRWTAGGVPFEIEHRGSQVTATWNGFAPVTTSVRGPGTVALPGRRRASFRAEARSIILQDSLAFEEVPVGISLTIPETSRRSLRVEVTESTGHRSSRIDVAGVAEWRSSWSELSRLHQIELTPALEVACTVRVTPLVQVASTAFGHHYHRSLYTPMSERVVTRPVPTGTAPGRGGWRDVDLFHLHWPEWVSSDGAEHETLIDELTGSGIPIVWTAHNLVPHNMKREIWEGIYRWWASAAAAVIHHSEWGERRMRDRYSFSPTCRHVVIPHGHFGGLYPSASTPRHIAERKLGLPPAKIRIGLLGAPRAGKGVVEFLEGVAASSCKDVQVVCWSLSAGARIPADPRIVVAETYSWTDPHTYGLRLAVCDALALPFDPRGEMLATGTFADAIGSGLAILGSDWGYLTEMSTGALIPCGHSVKSVRDAIDALDPRTIDEARTHSRELRARYDWRQISERTADLFEETLLR